MTADANHPLAGAGQNLTFDIELVAIQGSQRYPNWVLAALGILVAGVVSIGLLNRYGPDAQWRRAHAKLVHR